LCEKEKSIEKKARNILKIYVEINVFSRDEGNAHPISCPQRAFLLSLFLRLIKAFKDFYSPKY